MVTPTGAPRTGTGAASPSRLASWASDALREEAWLTPKPGLVDGRGPGAHRDMDIALLLRSAGVLERWFERLAEVSRGRPLDGQLRTDLGEIGRRAEADMLAHTGGVNTHRGALFSLGLLIAAAATGSTGTTEVVTGAGALAGSPDAGAPPEAESHGRRARLLVPLVGARHQAAKGFPAVVDAALPMLWRQRAAGVAEDAARLDTLLALMAIVDDTCVLYRGGPSGLRLVKTGARAALDAGGAGTPRGRSALAMLDDRLVLARLSPGGSGDLLAATLLLDRLAESPCRS